MTSQKQIEANRRNATKSTGPVTFAGKLQSRRNAWRHGLTAETVVATFEDAEDYEAFQEAVVADHDVETAVERELVLRLASLLWRLRRASVVETALFELTAKSVATAIPGEGAASDEPGIAQCFLTLLEGPAHALDRLARYEHTLWRQARQILETLFLLRRKRNGDSTRRNNRGVVFNGRRHSPDYEE